MTKVFSLLLDCFSVALSVAALGCCFVTGGFLLGGMYGLARIGWIVALKLLGLI